MPLPLTASGAQTCLGPLRMKLVLRRAARRTRQSSRWPLCPVAQKVLPRACEPARSRGYANSHGGMCVGRSAVVESSRQGTRRPKVALQGALKGDAQEGLKKSPERRSRARSARYLKERRDRAIVGCGTHRVCRVHHRRRPQSKLCPRLGSCPDQGPGLHWSDQRLALREHLLLDRRVQDAPGRSQAVSQHRCRWRASFPRWSRCRHTRKSRRALCR